MNRTIWRSRLLQFGAQKLTFLISATFVQLANFYGEIIFPRYGIVQTLPKCFSVGRKSVSLDTDYVVIGPKFASDWVRPFLLIVQ